MRIIRYSLVALCVFVGGVNSASARVNIDLNLSLFPELVPVPGYPVYYAPAVSSNYFFYDGMYWLFIDDGWYVSAWYNGPWDYVSPYYVPVYVLRIPVRYYRRPPPYFRGWYYDAPPRWGQRWGGDWEHRRRDWDKWDRRRAVAPAPLPIYQRHYTRDRYPQRDEQRKIREQNYRYQPREVEVRQRPEALERVRQPVQRDVRDDARHQRPHDMERQLPKARYGGDNAAPSRNREPHRRNEERGSRNQRDMNYQRPGDRGSRAERDQPRPRDNRRDQSRQNGGDRSWEAAGSR